MENETGIATRTEGTYIGNFRLQINLPYKKKNIFDNGKLSICHRKTGVCIELSKSEVIRLKDELEQFLCFMEGSIDG
jgi:hypothetical protein